MTLPAAALSELAAAWNSRDPGRLIELFTAQCVHEDVTVGTRCEGHAELYAFAVGLFQSIPDFHIEVTSRFLSRTWAATEWIMSGTHKGDMPGMPATGRRFIVRGSSIIRLEKGRISRQSDYWDAASVMRQLRLLAEMEETGVQALLAARHEAEQRRPSRRH